MPYCLRTPGGLGKNCRLSTVPTCARHTKNVLRWPAGAHGKGHRRLTAQKAGSQARLPGGYTSPKFRASCHPGDWHLSVMRSH